MTSMKSIRARFSRTRALLPPSAIPPWSDSLSRLPFELHCLLIAYLDPSDFMSVVNSCQSLRHIWLSDDLWPTLAERWFPGLAIAEHIYMTIAEGQRTSEVFRQALHKVLVRNQGKFGVALHLDMHLASDRFFQLRPSVPVVEGGVHLYESVEGLDLPDKRFSRFMSYSNGRIAWWPESYSMPYFAIVDDFRVRTRRAYLFPNHGGEKKGYKIALGDKILIMSRETIFNAWHLDQDRLQSFVVPGQIERCIVEGETALLISKYSDIYRWTYGEELKQLDTDKLGCYPRSLVRRGCLDFVDPTSLVHYMDGLFLNDSRMFIDFIVSPIEKDVFFLITLPSTLGTQLTVYEVRNAKVAGRYVSVDNIFPAQEVVARGSLKWEKIDSYGGYSLTQAFVRPSACAPNHESGYSECSCGSNFRFLTTTCFNIYTKTFKYLCHQIGISHHMNEWYIPPLQIWNDQLIAGDFVEDDLVESRRPVKSVDKCSRCQVADESQLGAPLYTTKRDRDPFISRRYKYSFRSYKRAANANFLLDPSQTFSPDGSGRDDSTGAQNYRRTRTILGDADYLVCVDQQKYVVWSFENDSPDKMERSGMNNVLRRKKNTINGQAEWDGCRPSR
ncbi:hypothetical protein F5Y15DRAFT_49444 [Xylariaceae sp. FL0016]|nr:hypothetical protein F5Y15DRAFT_49444 [Xylariaceae sp. FL0016]